MEYEIEKAVRFKSRQKTKFIANDVIRVKIRKENDKHIEREGRIASMHEDYMILDISDVYNAATTIVTYLKIIDIRHV